jgi:glycosyltransferase involved in cell wall biosynthesis
LVEGKGHETLLRAFATILQDHGDLSLVLVGDGHLGQHLVEVAARLGIGTHVTFAGATTDVARFLDAADVFVHPSESEGLSISGLEAALAGLPIVARALPCHRAYLQPGLNGLTFAEPAEPALARSIGEVCQRLDHFTAGAEQLRESLAGRIRRQFESGLAEVLEWR